MNPSSSSYTDAIDYLVKTLNHFDYSVYYNNFCRGLDRKQTRDKLKNDLEKCVFHFEASNPQVMEWIQQQLELGVPIEKTIEVEDFWAQLNQRKLYSLSKRYQSERNLLYEQEAQSTFMVESSSCERVLPQLNHKNVIEGDTCIRFDNRSISSILKSHGNRLYTNFSSLSSTDKVLCCYCLNGILDLTNDTETGQMQLFTADQWSYLKKVFRTRNMKHLVKVSRETERVIQKIIKKIKGGNPEEAYYKALAQIKKARSSEQCIFKILSHVINCYIERSYIFTANDPDATEVDYIVKLWGEILELLFGKESQYIKWGESVSKTTTAMKLVNNNNKPHTIGCKVDGRIICNVSKVPDENIDICQIEAARSTNEAKKVYGDKCKLAVESKCLVDDVILRPKFEPRGKYQSIQNLQLCGIQSEVCSLALVDVGLYIQRYEYDLSMKRSLLSFSDILLSWVRTLMSFQKCCRATSDISTLAVQQSTKSIHEAFGRDKPLSTPVYKCGPFWVRGTFFFPTSSDSTPTFPKNFLSSPSESNDMLISPSKKTTCFYLNDGTHVLSTFSPQVQTSGRSPINSTEESDAPQGNGKRKGRKQMPVINKKQKHNK